MAAAANFAWANRQYIAYWVRRSLEHVFHRNVEDIGMSLVYDVAHNIAKIERHRFEGAEVELCVHRKGATRAFSAGHPDVPERSAHARNTIAGSMPLIRRTRKNDATTAIASVMGDFVNGALDDLPNAGSGSVRLSRYGRVIAASANAVQPAAATA